MTSGLTVLDTGTEPHYLCVCVCTRAYVRVCLCLWSLCVCLCACVCTCMCMYVRVHVCLCPRVFVCMCSASLFNVCYCMCAVCLCLCGECVCVWNVLYINVQSIPWWVSSKLHTCHQCHNIQSNYVTQCEKTMLMYCIQTHLFTLLWLSHFVCKLY